MKAIRDYLASLCGDLEPDDVHWVHGGNEAQDWCYECCKAKVKYLRRHGERSMRKEYRVDGGYDTSEEDGPTYCEGCKKLLNYSLTSYGLWLELDHFMGYGLPSEIDPHTAYELLAIFEAAEYEEDEEIIRDVNRLAEQINLERLKQ
ncbi:MAG: hypothetical protein ACE14T_11170 [Syntrophales bacterium]